MHEDTIDVSADCAAIAELPLRVHERDFDRSVAAPWCEQVIEGDLAIATAGDEGKGRRNARATESP